MQALVIAAGLGSRMRPFTDQLPKQAIPVFGKSLFDHLNTNFALNNIVKVNYVTGHAKDFFEKKKNINCYFNQEYLSNNILHSMMKAKKVLEDCIISNEDLVISYGDIIFENEVLNKLINAQSDISIVVDTEWPNLYFQRPDNNYFGSEMVIYDKNFYITRIGRFFTEQELNQKNTGEFIGLWKLSVHGIRVWLEAFERLNHSLSMDDQFMLARQWSQAYISDFLAYLLTINQKIHMVEIKNNWLELDTVGDLKRCEAYKNLKDFEDKFYPPK